MPRITQWKTQIAIFGTYLFASLVFVIRGSRPNGFVEWLLWLIGLVISVFFLRFGVDFFWKAMCSRAAFKKMILGSTWIEGTWAILTIEHIGKRHTLVQIGLADFSYDSPELNLQCQVSSIKVPLRLPVETSVTCIILGDKLHYLHSFERHVNAVEEMGAAYGRFHQDKGSKPERYTGGVVFLNSDEGRNREQIGWKLGDKVVREAIDKYGNKTGWRQHALQNWPWVKEHCLSLLPSHISYSDETPAR